MRRQYSAAVSPQPAYNAILDLRFDNSCQDYSPNNITPSITGTVQYQDGCYVGKSNTYVRYDLVNHYVLFNDFRIKIKFKITNTSVASILFSSTPYSSTSGFSQTSLFVENGELSMAVREANGTSNPNTIYDCGLSVSANTWYDVVLERISGVVYCYANGSYITSFTMNKSVFNSYSRYFTVGNNAIYNPSGNYVKGLIDYIIVDYEKTI